MDTRPPDSGRLVLRRISGDTGNGWPISNQSTSNSSTPQIQPNRASLECWYRLTNRVGVLLSRRTPGLMLLASTAWQRSISFAKDMIYSEKQVFSVLFYLYAWCQILQNDIFLNMSMIFFSLHAIMLRYDKYPCHIQSTHWYYGCWCLTILNFLFAMI